MEEKKITAFKGFDKNLCCKGFQYKVGEEYEHTGDVKCCKSGFHACTNPFDVLDYYDCMDGNRFCEVEQYGTIVMDGSKQASSKIKIKSEIGLCGLIKAAVEWIIGKTNPLLIIKGETDKCDNLIGDFAKIGSSEDSAQIGSSGRFSQIGSSGDFAKIGSSGDAAKIGSSGYYVKIGSSGNNVQIGSSGGNVQIGSSGGYAKIGSSGNNAKIGSSGNNAKIVSSGDFAKIGSSGDAAKIVSSGDNAKIDSAGCYSVICCAGDNSIVKAKIGSWITLAEWVYSPEKGCEIPACVKTEFVDGKRIKADTWYKLIHGEFVEQ